MEITWNATDQLQSRIKTWRIIMLLFYSNWIYVNNVWDFHRFSLMSSFFYGFTNFFCFFFFLVVFFFFHANDWYCSLAFRESGIFCDNFVANNSLLICFSSNSEWFCFYFWFCFVRWYFYKNYKFCNNNKNFHDNCRN